MKVLHIAMSVSTQSASYRISQGLSKQGIDSIILVTQPSIQDKNVMYKVSRKQKIKSRVLNIIEYMMMNKFFKGQDSPFSTGFVSSIDYTLIDEISPDIIHLHWVCGGCISISDFQFLSKYNIVWTCHDSWPFTGGCHIHYDCEKYKKNCRQCEQLRNNTFFDLSHYIWKQKEKYYKNLHIIAPSRWLGECIKNSSILKKFKSQVIGNGIDIKKYKPIDKSVARDLLGIPMEKKIILFGAINSTSDSNKGFDILKQSIEILNIEKLYMDGSAEIIIFGSNEPPLPVEFALKTTYIGRLYDDISLAVVYAAADVMVVPSKSESFGQTAMEALACGTPCVAFNCTGLTDIIDHKLNGYLAEPYRAEDLAKGIDYVIKDEQRWAELSKNARKKIIDNFDIDIIAQKYIEVYNKILNERK